jgi:multidrug efflux pump subunit AcrB
MVMMLLSGVIALDKLNVQFFPNFELDQISVSTIWSGASSEDIESGLTIPLEQRLRSIDNLGHHARVRGKRRYRFRPGRGQEADR